ncbi:hypothetical protein KY315_00850 [Candidatus Woesearchaeota archaeon]|nr:hypothetical protein [Candidatus Woesearchaeota archaeon]
MFSAIANAPSSPEQKKQEKDAVIELVSQLVGVTQINTQYLPELEQVKSEILSKRSQYWIAPENSAKRRQILEELKELEDKMRDLSLKISAANFYTRGQEFSIQDFQNLGIPSGINNKGEIEYKPITSILWNQDAKTVWKDMYDNLADTFSGSRGSESGKQERDRAYTSLKVLGDANEHLQREQQRLSLILQKFEKTKNEILSARGMTQTQYMLLEEGLSQAFNNLKESGAWVWDEVLPYISPFRHLFGNSNYKRDQDKELKNAILGAEEIKSKLRVNAQQIARNLEKMTGYSGLIEELAEQGDTLSVARLSWAMGLISTNTLENQLSYFEHDPKYASDSSAKSEIAQLRKDMETRSDSKMSYQLSKNKLESEGKFDEFIDEGIGILDYLNIPYLFQRSNDDDSFSKSAWLDKSSQDGFRVFKKIRELLKTKGINAKDINTGIYSAIHGLLNYENEPEATTEKVIPFIKEWLERNFGLTSSECNTMSDKELIDFAMYWTLYGANKVKELQGKLTGNDLARSAILLGDLRKEAGDLVRAASDYSLGMSAGTGEIAEIAAKSKWSTEIEENKKQNRRFLAQMYLDPLNLLPAAGLLVIITKLKKVQTIVQGLKALLDFTARISGLKYTAGLLVKAKNLIPGVRKLTPIKWGENFLGKYKQLYQGIEAESSIAAAKEAGFKIKKSSVKRGLGIRESTSAARLTKRQKSIDLMKKVIARNPSKENMAKLNKLIKGDAAATGTARLGLETLQQQSTVAQTVRKNTGFLASTLGRHLWGDTARYQGLIRKLTAQLGKAEKTGNAAEITKLNKQIYEATKLFNQAKAASISGKSYSFVGKIFSFIGTIFRTNLGETFTPIKKQVRIAEELPSSKATSIIVEHADDAKTGRISKSAYKSETAANTAAKEAEGTIPKKVTTKPPVEAPAQVYDVQAGVKKTSEKLGVDISDPALNPEMRATFNQDTALDLVRERIDPNAQVSDFAAEVDEISYGFAIKNKNGDDILLVSVQDDGETIIRSIDVAPEYRGKGLESKLSEIDDAMYRRSHADYKSITETTDMEIASDSIARGSAPNSYNTPLESEQLDRLLKGYSDEALHGDLGVGMELNGPMSKNLQKSYDEWSGVRSMMTGEGYAAEDIAIGLRRAGYELDDIRDVMKSDDFLMKSKASELGYGLDEIELDDLVNKIFEDASHKSQTLADSAKADAAKAGSEGLESLVASAERAELNLKRLAGDFDSAMFKKETFVASNAAPTAEELTRLKRLSLKKVNELKSKAADALNTPPTAAEREFTALYRGRPVSADPAELEEAIRTIIEQGEMSGAARQGRPISGVAEDTIREGIRKHQYDEQPFVISTSTSRDLAENFAITREINGKKYGSLIIEIDPKGIARGQLDISTALSADDLGRISKEGHFDPRLLNRPHSTGYEHEVLFIGDRIPSENIKAIYYDGQLVYGRDLATAEKATPKITAAPKTVAEAQGAVPTAKISPKPLREVGKGTAGKSIVYEGEVIVEGTGRQSAVKVFQRSEDVADELVNTKKLKDITIKDPSTGAQRPIARGIIGDGKITYEGKQGIAFEYLDGVPLQSDNVGEWSKLLNPNSGEQLDLIRTALKDKGLAIDDFQAMVLKTDQEIGGVMLRKGDVVVFDVEAITNVDELANVWKDLGKTPDEIESLIALEYRNLDAAVDAVKTRTPVVIEASTPEAAAKAAAEAKSAVPLPIPVEAKSTATRMRNFYGEFMKNPKYKSVYQNDEFMENLGKYMYDDVAKAKVDSIAAESGLTHSDIMGPKVLAEGGPAYADRLAGASNTAQDFSKTSGFLSPAETWVVESAVGGSDDVSLARFYDIFGNDPVVYNSLREEYITFLKNKGYVTEVYDGAFDSLRVAMDSSASRVASEFPETVLTVPKAAGPSTELRWTRRSGAAKDFASDFKVSTSAEEAIFTKMAGGTGPESKAVFFDAFDHPDVYATLKNDFMAYAQKEGLDTLAFDEAFTRIRSNMNKASADRAILEARASAPGIVRPGSLDDLGRQIAESDTVFARLNTQYDDAVSKHSAYQKYFDENANYVNFDEYQDMVAELDRLKRNVDDFDYYRTQEAFDRMQLELKYRVMKEAKAKSAAEAAKEALETVPIKAPTPGALPDDLLESQLSLSELQTRMALGSVDPSELKGISLGGKSHNAREITLGGKKFVIKYFREGDALAMTQLKNELAARKIIKKYFPEIGVPDAVAFVGSDGNTYLLSEFVDVGVDLDRFYNLPMGARSDLTVSELIFGLSDLSGENVLFNKQGRLFNIDLENFALDKYVPNKRGFKISVDWGFEPHFEKAVKEAGKTKHLPLSLEDDFGAALQKVNSLKSNPDFLADVRTTLKEVGYADDKIDDAVKAIKTNLDNFEDNLNQLIKWRDEIRKPVVSDVPVKAPTVPVTIQEIEKGIINDYKLSTKDMNPILPENGILRQGDEFIVKHPDLGEIKATMISDDAAEVIIPTYSGTVRPFEIKINPKYNLQQKQAQIRVGISEELVPKIRSRLNRYKGQAFKKGVQEKITPELLDKRTQEVIQSVFLEDPVMQEIAAKYLLTENPQVRAFIQEVVSDSGFVPKRNLLAMYNPTIKGVMVPELASAKDLVAMKSTVFHEFLHHALQVMPDAQRKSLMQRILQSEDFQKFSKFMKNSKLSSYREGTELLKVGEYISYKGQAIMSGESFILTPAADTITNLDDILKGRITQISMDDLSIFRDLGFSEDSIASLRSRLAQNLANQNVRLAELKAHYGKLAGLKKQRDALLAEYIGLKKEYAALKNQLGVTNPAVVELKTKLDNIYINGRSVQDEILKLEAPKLTEPSFAKVSPTEIKPESLANPIESNAEVAQAY